MKKWPPLGDHREASIDDRQGHVSLVLRQENNRSEAAVLVNGKNVTDPIKFIEFVEKSFDFCNRSVAGLVALAVLRCGGDLLGNHGSLRSFDKYTISIVLEENNQKTEKKMKKFGSLNTAEKAMKSGDVVIKVNEWTYVVMKKADLDLTKLKNPIVAKRD